MPKQFQHACRFLRQQEKIAEFLAAIDRNTRLLREIQGLLPAPLDDHCLHASFEAGVLTLLTDSPVWSSRLRFFFPELERKLIPRYGSIVACHVRIQPQASASAVAPGTIQVKKLSEKTARHLMDAAAGIRDTQLAAALRRLAKAGSGYR